MYIYVLSMSQRFGQQLLTNDVGNYLPTSIRSCAMSRSTP